MRWLSLLLVLAACAFAAACNRDRGPRMAPYTPEPASSSGGPDAGGMSSPDGGSSPSTAPTIQPQPGDIQL